MSRWLLSILLLTISPVIWSSSGETIESWGKEHYETYGRDEGRTPPASGNYAHYVWQNPDLLLAYESTLDSDKDTQNVMVITFVITQIYTLPILPQITIPPSRFGVSGTTNYLER